MRATRVPALLVFGLSALVALAGCGQEPPEVPVPVSSQSTVAQAGQSGTGGPTPSVTPLAHVPEFCEQLLTFNEVAQIVAAGVPAGLGRLYNDDTLPSSGRTAQLVCDYGQGGPDGDEGSAAVTIAVSSYETGDQAAARLDEASAGADSGSTVRTTSLQGRPALLVTGGGTNSYAVVDDTLALVVSVSDDLVPDSQKRVVLSELASAALRLSQTSESET